MFLIERKMSRVLYNISLGEKQLGTLDELIPLDDVASQPGIRQSRVMREIQPQAAAECRFVG